MNSVYFATPMLAPKLKLRARKSGLRGSAPSRQQFLPLRSEPAFLHQQAELGIRDNPFPLDLLPLPKNSRELPNRIYFALEKRASNTHFEKVSRTTQFINKPLWQGTQHQSKR